MGFSVLSIHKVCMLQVAVLDIVSSTASSTQKYKVTVYTVLAVQK